MAFFKRDNSGIERAAMALAAAGGVAHGVFFTMFAWRVIGRDGIGTVGWAILALFALLGMGLNFAGFWLVRSSRGRRWGAVQFGSERIRLRHRSCADTAPDGGDG